MTDNEEWQKFEEEVARRLQEGNITEEEMYPKWRKRINNACRNHDAQPDEIINLCYKLRFTDFIGDTGIEDIDSEQNTFIKRGYSGVIYDYFVTNLDCDTETRHKAWNTYKNIITSEKSVPEEGRGRIFDYLQKSRDNNITTIYKDNDTFIKNEMQDMAYYLMDKYPQRRAEGLFALYSALDSEQINISKLIKYVDNLVQNQSYTPNEVKIMISVCDEVAEKSPAYRNNALKNIKRLYQSTDDKATRIRCNNVLYRIASKYPKLKDAIENDILLYPIKEPRYDKLPDKEWLHIGGEDKPCDEKFNAVFNESVYIQIRGGLYTAPIAENGLSEWDSWSKINDFYEKETHNYYIVPKNHIKCLVAYSEQDIEPYLVKSSENTTLIDAKALARDYDCFYLENPRSKNFSHDFDDYDVSSLIFLRPNTFTAYTKEEYAQHKALQQKLNEVRKSANIQETEGSLEKTTTISPANLLNARNNNDFEGR